MIYIIPSNYVCEDCGHTFETPKLFRETFEMYGHPDYNEYEGCPRCGGWSIYASNNDEDDPQNEEKVP